MSINVGISGSVSVGKTTVLNSLIGQYIGQTSRKRSTYVPFKFNHNLKCKEYPIDWIKNNIESLNEKKDEMEVINYDVCFDWIKEEKEFSIIYKYDSKEFRESTFPTNTEIKIPIEMKL